MSIGEGKDLYLVLKLALLLKFVGLRWEAGRTNGAGFTEGTLLHTCCVKGFWGIGETTKDSHNE